MNITLDRAKTHLKNQKKMYLFLTILTLIGIISGILFVTILSKNDKVLVADQLNHFFTSVHNGEINYTNGFLNSLGSNILYCIGVWLLGISVIGLPFIVFFLYMKGFITGFSIGSIIALYKWKGIIGSIAYIFPHHIISLILSIMLSFYAINFCAKLFSYLFLKKEINFKQAMHRYIKIFIICFIGFIIVSVIEIYLSPFLIKLFTNL